MRLVWDRYMIKRFKKIITDNNFHPSVEK